MKNFIVLALFLLGLGSCQKEGIPPVTQETTSSRNTPSSDQPPLPDMETFSTIDPWNDQSPSTANMKVSPSNIMSATNANQIASRFFSSASIYEDAYIHITQYDGECSWTSYVLCASAIANGNANACVYPATHDQITSVKTWCGDSYIDQLQAYASQNDNAYFSDPSLFKEEKTSAGRFTMVKNMLYHLYVYQKPFIAIITSNSIGHYVVVWDIDWKCGGSQSLIYYTDPLDDPTAFSSQLKSMSLTSFLNKMGPSNSYTSSYCALFLR